MHLCGLADGAALVQADGIASLQDAGDALLQADHGRLVGQHCWNADGAAPLQAGSAAMRLLHCCGLVSGC
jgi:hypothetical protein